MGARARRLWLAACGFSGLFVCITFPLILQPAGAIVASSGDGFFDMLLFWYARTGSLAQSHVDTLFHPWGVEVGAEQGYWLVPYLSVPLQWFLPLPLAFNVICVAFFVGTGVATFLLATEIGLPAEAAFLSGALVVLSPSYLNEMSAGILENMAMLWPIMYVWCGLRLRHAPSLPLALSGGLFLTLSVLTSFYLGAFALVLTLLLPARRLLAGFALAAVLLAVPLGLVFHNAAGVGGGQAYDGALARTLVEGRAPSAHGLDQAVATEGTRQVLEDSADWSRLLTSERTGRTTQFLPGLLALALGALGLVFMPREHWRWALATLLLASLALGPWLLWRGGGLFPLPSEWLYTHVGLLSRLRPIRWLLPASVTLALLAGFALPRLRARWMSLALVGFLVVLQVVEVTRVQMPAGRILVADATVPAFYTRVAKEADGGALIELPIVPYTLALGQNLYYQTVHGRPLLNYNFLTPASKQRLAQAARENSLIGALTGERARVTRADAEAVARLGYGQIVLHSRVAGTPSQSHPTLDFTSDIYDTLRSLYGAPIDEGDGLLVFHARDIRAEAFDERGVLREPITQSLVRPFLTRESGQRLDLGAARPAAWRWVRGWVRGRGACLSACFGQTVTSSRPTSGDGWEWVEIQLPDGQEASLQVTVEGAATVSDVSARADAHQMALRGPQASSPSMPTAR